MRVLLPFLFLPVCCAAQRDSFPAGFYTEKRASLALGYNFNFGKATEEDTLKTNFHLLEIGIWQTKFFFARHWGGFGYYGACEVGLNTPKFTIGPKIGAFLALGPILLGNDLTWYTDFGGQSLRWVPYFGVGSNRFKLTINPHVIFTNPKFTGSRRGHLNLSIAVANFMRKRTPF